MNINIELQRKPEDYRLDNCVIDVVEEIPHESFETFQNYPTARYGAITNSLHRLPEDTKNERHCILLLDADGNDGFLVNPHGADYARYSAFVPNARQILQLQSPSLEEFAGRMCRMVEKFTAQALQKQENGTYTLDLDEVDSACDCELFDRTLFTEMIAERSEFFDVEENNGDLILEINPEFRKAAAVRHLSQGELDVICAKHSLWLNDAGGEQADLSNCVLRGLFLCGRDLSHSICNRTVFDDCNLQSADFSNAVLVGTGFENCDMHDIYAKGANLTNASLTGCNLSGTTAVECMLTNAAVKDCNLDAVYSLDCKGEPEVFSDDEAEGLSPIL